jgi:protein-tyrosine-phosphatase
MSDWKKLFRENMAADPDFAAYVKGLEPGTPLTPTGKEHVALLKLRARTLQKEAREADDLVALMDANRFENTHQLWAAVERGEVTLPESAIELLLRIGAIEERR